MSSKAEIIEKYGKKNVIFMSGDQTLGEVMEKWQTGGYSESVTYLAVKLQQGKYKVVNFSDPASIQAKFGRENSRKRLSELFDDPHKIPSLLIPKTEEERDEVQHGNDPILRGRTVACCPKCESKLEEVKKGGEVCYKCKTCGIVPSDKIIWESVL